MRKNEGDQTTCGGFEVSVVDNSPAFSCPSRPRPRLLASVIPIEATGILVARDDACAPLLHFPCLCGRPATIPARLCHLPRSSLRATVQSTARYQPPQLQRATEEIKQD